MAIVQMSTLGEAVDALVAMHQYPLTDRNRIRVSFAKSPGHGHGHGHGAGHPPPGPAAPPQHY